MKIVSGNAPFLRRKRSTGHIMRELLIGLGVIFVAAVVYNFTLGVRYGLKAIGIMTVSLLFTLISDIIAGSFRFNKEKDGQYAEYLVTFVKTNFSAVTAVIFSLTVPIGTPVYVVAVGSIFATLIVKHAFGGFGSNIFNPAAAGRIFLALAFGGQLKAYLPGGESLGGMTAGVTVTSQFASSGTKFLTGTVNIPMLDLWLGNHSGAIGETFIIVILVVGVVLAAREVINWRTPVFLFGTVLLSSVFIALIAKVDILNYILLQFGLGGLVFGAIFMFTDPVTSPTSNQGKALIGILGGLFNVLIRIAGVYPEGTAFSILLVNVFSPMIDRFISGRTDTKLWKPITTSAVMVLLSVGLLSGVSAAKLPKTVTPPSSSEPIEEPVGTPYKTYNGTYVTDPGPAGQTFTTNASVVLTERFHILEVTYDTIDTPDRLSEVEHTKLKTFYTSLSVAEFKLLPAPMMSEDTTGTTVAEQTGDYILPGAIYSSRAIYEAIKDALKGISVYRGEETSLPADSDYVDPLKLVVDVYVDTTADTILTLDIIEGITTTTQTFVDRWEAIYDEMLAKYQDLSIATFKGFATEIDFYGAGGTELVTGVSWSPRRLFRAVQIALEGYGI